MPNLYHSDLHLPRWKRVLLWLVESPKGRVLFWTLVVVLLGVPLYYWGAIWVAVVLAWAAGVAMGHWAARSEWKESGRIEKL